MSHTTEVSFAPGRYPYKPHCICGWTERGYLVDFAAQMAADDHEKEAARAESA